jgi:hypothetical protein
MVSFTPWPLHRIRKIHYEIFWWSSQNIMAGNLYKKLKFKIMLSASRILETNKWLINEVLTSLWSNCPVYGNVPWFSPRVSLSGDRDYSVCLCWNETRHSTECKQWPNQTISCKYTLILYSSLKSLWIQYNIHFIAVSVGKDSVMSLFLLYTVYIHHTGTLLAYG